MCLMFHHKVEVALASSLFSMYHNEISNMCVMIHHTLDVALASGLHSMCSMIHRQC